MVSNKRQWGDWLCLVHSRCRNSLPISSICRMIAVPIFPSNARSELREINRAYVLDGGRSIPVLQGSLTLGINHAVCPGIEEVFPDSWSLLVACSVDNVVYNANGVEFAAPGNVQQRRPRRTRFLVAPGCPAVRHLRSWPRWSRRCRDTSAI